jgi:FkbM family methyltransferase
VRVVFSAAPCRFAAATLLCECFSPAPAILVGIECLTAKAARPSRRQLYWRTKSQVEEMTDHPIFKKFKRFRGEVPPGFYTDFIGSLTDIRFLGLDHLSSETIPPSALGPNDEYFEWISLLESVDQASTSFTIVEIGAGFGRWTARAALAARQRGISSIRAILVEAEPLHAKWAREHMANNRVGEIEIVEAMVGSARGRQLFIVRQPAQQINAGAWYGQAANWTDDSHHLETNDTYLGHKIIDNGAGWGGILVDVKPLSDILPASVDLLDMDIQGAEADVIEAGLDALNTCVKRVHIGTHSAEIEQRVRAAFQRVGWSSGWDFPVQSEKQTPYGVVKFDDGVQSWINPRLT